MTYNTFKKDGSQEFLRTKDIKRKLSLLRKANVPQRNRYSIFRQGWSVQTTHNDATLTEEHIIVYYLLPYILVHHLLYKELNNRIDLGDATSGKRMKEHSRKRTV